MPFNNNLADRIREFLSAKPNLKVEEKKMFRGLTFMVNDKMCVCVSNDNLMWNTSLSTSESTMDGKI